MAEPVSHIGWVKAEPRRHCKEQAKEHGKERCRHKHTQGVCVYAFVCVYACASMCVYGLIGGFEQITHEKYKGSAKSVWQNGIKKNVHFEPMRTLFLIHILTVDRSK